MKQKQKTIYQYLAENLEKGVIDHELRAHKEEDGTITFYIHAQGKDSDTLDFKCSAKVANYLKVNRSKTPAAPAQEKVEQGQGSAGQ